MECIVPKVELSQEERQAIEEHLILKGLPIGFNVTFDDVCKPGDYCEAESRSKINNFKTFRIFSDLEISFPVVSANMECVTGVELALALAEEGSFGFLPQMLPLEERLEMIEKIRRTDCAFIAEPLTIGPEQTLYEAREIMSKLEIWSLIVIDKNRKPIGILSSRDWRYETDLNQRVAALMTANIIKCCDSDSGETIKVIMRRNKIEKIPVVDEAGKLVGLYTAHGIFYKPRHPKAQRDQKGRFLTMGSIGVGKDDVPMSALLHEVEAQLKSGASFLLIDTPVGYGVLADQTLKAVKAAFKDLRVIIGNVCTPEGAKSLFELGADCIKVGVGPGEACRTREVTGVGIPQISAIAKCSVIARRYGKTTMADGGMKTDGDFINAIIAGADSLMAGSFFMKTEEAAAKSEIYYESREILKEGVKVKEYSGSASYEAQAKRLARGDLKKMRRPEGTTKKVPVITTVKDLAGTLIDSFRSAMSYHGAWSIDELRGKAVFELQTNAGRYEGIKK